MSDRTTKKSWTKMKAVETEEARRARLQKKLDDGGAIEEDEVTDVLELAQLKLRESHDACTKELRDTIAEVDAALEKP